MSNRSFFTKPIPSHPAAPVKLRLNHLDRNTAYRLRVYRTGYHANDAYTAYLEMGSPKQLTGGQTARLNELTRDLPETEKVITSGKDGSVECTVPMNSSDIVLVTLVRN